MFAVRVASLADAVVDESMELTPISVPRGAGSDTAENAQQLVETPPLPPSLPSQSLKIPLSWSCGEVPNASGFGETPDMQPGR